MSSTEMDYWDCDDCTERLSHEDKDEAIEAHLEGLDLEVEGEFPEEIEVFGYKRTEVNPARFKSVVLESASEYLSENFDGEDGHDQNKAIEDAAEAFVKVYLENYTTWNCNLVVTEKVNVKEWILKNRPEWITK
jgi:hypothetical protein